MRHFPVKTPVKTIHKKPICCTCNSPIEDLTYRFLIVKDQNITEKVLNFHYFFPCWDVHYVFENLIGYEICKAGFSCDESILKNPKNISNLQKNYDLWDLQTV